MLKKCLGIEIKFNKSRKYTKLLEILEHGISLHTSETMALEGEYCVTCVNGNHVYNEISLWSLPFVQPALNITRCHTPQLVILVCVLTPEIIVYRSYWI